MSKYIISIDLGGTATKLGLFNFRDKLLMSTSFSTEKKSSKKALIQAICQEIEKLISNARLKKNQIKAIGMGVPGPINSKKGLVYYFPNIPGWKNTPIKKIMEDKLGIPVFIDNDVNLMTLAEFIHGAGKGAQDIICMTLGTGVGGGLIINGKLFRGSKLVAGEIGHIPIELNGAKCNCGGRGCLESYVGNKSILKIANRYFGSKITLIDLERKAKKGNKIALRIWRDTGAKIGMALTGVANLLNPERIIIGGGVAKAGRILFDSIRKTVRENAMPIQGKSVKIVKSRLGYTAGLIGAAAFARIMVSGGEA